jgi:predicted transcriptional regulator
MARKKKTQIAAEHDESSANGSALIALATDLVSSYFAHNQVPAGDVSAVVRKIHASLAELSGNASANALHALTPAVPAKKSISDDFIICLEDGKKLKTLKRYLATHYKLSPDEYRAKWRLPRDYPMVAPAYARLRSAFAKKIGLGRVPGGARSRRGAKTA